MLPCLLLAALLPALPARAASYPEELVARARELRLAQDPEWLALGHYRKRLFGGYESEVEPSQFFISPKGRTDPEAELEATILEFFEPDPGARAPALWQNPQCRFPARFWWLDRKLHFDARLPRQASCPRFDEWRKTIDASSVTLVFADAFLNNPGSMYGHTFLRLERKGEESGESLLDYTINYAGNPTTDNGVLYAVEGIFGMFPASYTTMPFYMKVQEYTNIESRDLWEYDLALSSTQVAQLMRHAWEMGSAKFNYWFFSENCSYQLLTLLDAADPSAHLAEKFGFGVVPLDTLRAARAVLGDGRSPVYRPSHVTQMLARRARLTRPELALATELGRSPAPADWTELQGLAPRREALVLDSADDYLRYRTGFTNELPEKQALEERSLLVARGRLGVPPQDVSIPAPMDPELGHPTHRLAVGFGGDKRTGFTEVEFRAALHDLPSGDAGYIPYSQLEMGDARLRFDHRKKQAYIERLDLVNLVSLSPWDPWIHRPSWKVSTGVDQAREYGCVGADCMYYNLNAGGGLSAVTHLFRRELYYGFLETDWGAGPVLERSWRAGAGGTAGFLFDISRSARVQVEAQYVGYDAGPAREQLRVIGAYNLSRGLEARVSLSRRVPSNEASFSLLGYF